MWCSVPGWGHGAVEEEDAFVVLVECQKELPQWSGCSVVREKCQGLWNVDGVKGLAAIL